MSNNTTPQTGLPMKSKKSWGTPWEIMVALFWLAVAFSLIAINHPKVQKIISLVLSGRFEVGGRDKF